jgi:hypothetical protein
MIAVIYLITLCEADAETKPFGLFTDSRMSIKAKIINKKLIAAIFY